MKIYTSRCILPITAPIIPDGAIAVLDGKIEALGPRETVLKNHPEAPVEDFGQAVLMPGLVNAHTHLDLLFQQASGESPQFFDWLAAGWDYRRKQTLTDRRHALEEGMQQLLRSGTTTVGDAGSFVGLVPQAANCPMRMVLFPELLHGGSHDIGEDYEGAFSQVEEILATRSSRLSAGIAPYAAYTLSRHLLKIIAQQAAALKIPLLIHVAETFQEMQFFYESSGEIADKLFPRMGWKDMLPPSHRKTPVQYLDSIGFLDARPSLVGGNQLSDADLTSLARRDCSLIHAPRSNAHLKIGTPPLAKLRSLNIPVALGTNGTASLHSLSLWDEMRFIRDHYPEGDRPEDSELLRMATLNGARALGLADRIGSLEPGKEADLIAVRLEKDAALSDVISRLLSQMTDRDVMAIIIEGKRVKL